ncbi:hypothetical protein C8Q80DRAFT_100861 [Daedaleopsis nitida]|nr:hypothetical protein C8Q80DRAFT_100861 [Daedaleopsis nitida]
MALAANPRQSPFTVEEFSELVSSAFNLHNADNPSPADHPLLSFTPASPHSLSSLHSLSGDPDGGAVDDSEATPLRSLSLDSVSPHRSPPPTSARSRTITALRVFHQVRTRASAFVLRSRAPSPSHTRSPSPALFEPLPLPSVSPTPESSLSRALSPWSMLDLTRPRSRAESLPRSLFSFPKRDATPPPLPDHPSRSGSTTSGTRSLTPVLRSFFDDSPVRSKRAYSRPATTSTTSSTMPALSRVRTSSSACASHLQHSPPSFFDDSGYQVPRPPAPPYSRPDTPTGAARIHTRLPPLRKSRSNGHGLKDHGHKRDPSRGTTGTSNAGLGYQDSPLWDYCSGTEMPSPLTRPRDAPPVPGLTAVPPLKDLIDDDDAPLPPPYVFERRGSATSTSTASTRSSSSLSSRLSNLVGLAFPGKMRARGRSKLNLSVSTGSEGPSAESSPSTLSTVSSPSTPSSPISTFSRSQGHVYAASADGHSGERYVQEDEEDSLAIGRVLTPDADPFAKADIAIPVQGTPRPPSPLLSRQHSMQYSPYGANRTVTWDASPGKARKKTRNSLPASPVSTAYTFPSSCSVYSENSPSHSHCDPPSMWTRKHQGPPSAWSLLTPPGTPPSNISRAASSPKRTPPSMPRFQSQRNSPSKCLMFPLPPTNIPHSRLPPSLPPPDRPLPEPPLSPLAPPVPPKDRPSRIARAHKSLPASPEVTRSGGMARHYRDLSDRRPPSAIPIGSSLGRCTLDTLASLQEGTHASGVHGTPSLGEPWSEHISDAPSRSVTPVMHIPPANRRSSVDSISTVTASPSSSALHEAAGRWVAGSCALSRDKSTIVEGNSYSVDGASTTLSSPPPLLQPKGNGLEAAELWSPATSGSTMFYSARSSVDCESRFSFETDSEEEARPQSFEDQPVSRVSTGWRHGKAASAGPCT